jgi:hypothetical protein
MKKGHPQMVRKLVVGLLLVGGVTGVAAQALSGPLRPSTAAPTPTVPTPGGPDAVQGCVASTPGNNTQPPNYPGYITRDGSCTYQAFGAGGYAAAGAWTITVTHASGTTTTYSSTHDKACQTDVIRAGDTVFASAGVSGGFVAVGNAQAATPSLAGNQACPT